MFLIKESIESKLLLTESAGTAGQKFTYMEGIFAQAEKPNRNGRIYPLGVMKPSMDMYINEYVKKNRALGEISHPEQRPDASPQFASHLITELQFRGNDVYGKARIIENANGQILKGLLASGVQMGVSTRGLGTVTESNTGVNMVDDGYVITAIDAVVDPSGIDCFVDAINESREWLVTDDGKIIERTQRALASGKLTESKKIALFADFIRSL